MTLKFKILIYILISAISLNVHAKSLCASLFDENLEQYVRVSPEVLAHPIKLLSDNYDAREFVQSKFKIIFKNFFASQMIDAKIAINLSPRGTLHVVSRGLTKIQHDELMKFIEREQIDHLLAGIPNFLRNKYFEVKIDKKENGQHTVTSETKFSWQLSFAVDSQLRSGFAIENNPATDLKRIRPFIERSSLSTYPIRTDLLSQRRSQDTLVTCGLSSLAQVLNAKGIPVGERELLRLTESLGIKTKADIFGNHPGLELSQLAQLITQLGKRYNFTVTMRKMEGEEDTAKFNEIVRRSSEGLAKVDIILNYHSPEIGRPGHGHFSPVAGFDIRTNELLVSETNLTANPPFWVELSAMLNAMKASAHSAEGPRGYIVIEWK